MDVEKVFHMNGGIGKTSYAQNSSLQKKASDMVKNITMETLQDLYNALTPKSLGIADLGCSSGPNSLSLVKALVETVEQTSHKSSNPMPEFRIYLNDLPTTDFNSVFKSLPDFYRDLKKYTSEEGGPGISIAAYPGSFYGRLFPYNYLHFIYSSFSLHWLSKVPPGLYNEDGKSMNKGNVYISESSPPSVSQAYYNQFRDDFSLFLKSRSKEVVTGGRMVLILLGRIGEDHVDRGNSFLWEIFSRSLAVSVSSETEKEKLDSYEVHFYAASRNEIEDEVRGEGSFKMERLEMFEIEREVKNAKSYGTAVAMAARAIQESILCNHFGNGLDLDKLFKNYGEMVDEEMAKEDIKPIAFVVVLKKL